MSSLVADDFTYIRARMQEIEPAWKKAMKPASTPTQTQDPVVDLGPRGLTEEEWAEFLGCMSGG